MTETILGQRISGGASDWYLRFRSERDLDRPETVKYWASSQVVVNKMVNTTISRIVFNPANVTQSRLTMQEIWGEKLYFYTRLLFACEISQSRVYIRS